MMIEKHTEIRNVQVEELSNFHLFQGGGNYSLVRCNIGTRHVREIMRPASIPPYWLDDRFAKVKLSKLIHRSVDQIRCIAQAVSAFVVLTPATCNYSKCSQFSSLSSLTTLAKMTVKALYPVKT